MAVFLCTSSVYGRGLRSSPAEPFGELQRCFVWKTSMEKFADGPLTHRSSHAMN